MKPSSVIEIIDACHLTAYVESTFPQRGGLMLVAPPGALKSTLIEIGLHTYPDALTLTDLNMNTLVKMRDDLTAGRYNTMGFPEYEKLYQRNPGTASNIEGSIKALTEEGFIRASFEDQRIGGIKARVFVVGAMTPAFFSAHYDGWKASGFARRFLWSAFSVKNSNVIMESIHQWKRLNLDGIPRRYPDSGEGILFDVNPQESRYLQRFVKDQPGTSTPYVLLKKIYCCLKWKYAKLNPKKAREIIDDFGASLFKDGTQLVLPGVTLVGETKKRRKKKPKRKKVENEIKAEPTFNGLQPEIVTSEVAKKIRAPINETL